MKRSPRADSTKCVHVGEDRHGKNAPLTTPIAQASVFSVAGVSELKRYNEGARDLYLYSRYGNPTVRAAEEKIAALENAEDCVLTSSGMSAELAAILALCKAGDEIVTTLDIYGGSTNLFTKVLPRCGITAKFVPYDDVKNISRYFSRKTRLLFLETPTNPVNRCVSIRELSEAAHKKGITVLVDNTFATPILQKPLEHGADLVMHSATKSLGGHSDLTAGAVCGPKKIIDQVREMMVNSGVNSDAFIAYLLLRGLKTLQIRVERAALNAFHVAEFLATHRKVSRVYYPGNPADPSHRIALTQMRDFGTMVSFDAKGGGAAAERFIDALKLWTLATSLGGVESTVSYPVLSSHKTLKSRDLRLLGVSAATVRLSVGIEDSADLLADLEQALDRL